MAIKKAELYKKEASRKVSCFACSQRCLIAPEKMGICGVRRNLNGELFLLVSGRIASANVDPIEKKPLYHFMPNTLAYSIGTVGCNFKCAWCQNFDISQVAKEGIIFGDEMKPEDIVQEAIKTGCKSIAYTYNEPAIWLEFVMEIARIAKKRGLRNILVTNGYFTLESLQYFEGFIDAANVDMKSFSDATYKRLCGAKLKPVCDSIRWMHKHGVHVEITTLVIPDINDSSAELTKIAKFIAGIDKKIPWHISRFFPMYKMKNKDITPKSTLERAYEIGKKAGLKYVHLGNI